MKLREHLFIIAMSKITQSLTELATHLHTWVTFFSIKLKSSDALFIFFIIISSSDLLSLLQALKIHGSHPITLIPMSPMLSFGLLH
jgi:hypothetical protein